MAKQMPAALFLLAFSSGVIAHRFVDELIPAWVAVAVLLALATAAYWFKFVRVLLLFAMGMVWANSIASTLLNTTIPRELEQQDVVASGTIIGVPVQTPHYARFNFDVEALEWQGKLYPSPGTIRLKAYYHREKFKANQRWRFTVRLKKSRSYQNPGSRFNYETYLFENRIRGTGYVRDQASNQMIAASVKNYSVSGFRERISNFIHWHFQNDPHHGILTALIVGVRGAMRDDHWRILQNTGTIHLVAISGLHIGLVSGLVIWLVSMVWRFTGQIQTRIPALNAGVISGLITGFCYATLAGMTIPTRRAVVMLSVLALSMLCKRRPAAFELLILVLAVVLVIDPLSPLAAGFWLSFGAVAVIVGCLARFGSRAKNSNNISPRPNPGQKLAQKSKRWLSVQLGLSLGLAPLLLLLFNQVSIIAPLANLIAIPVIGFIVVPVALIGLFLFALGMDTGVLLIFQFSLKTIEYLWFVLRFLGDANWSVWQPSAAPLWILMAAAMGMLLLLLRAAFPARITAIAWLLPLFLFRPEKPDHGAFRYTLLEVGHGLASVVETRNHVLVYDTGPKFRGGLDAGKTVVVPYLKARGISGIDTLIISHEHDDHAGGFAAVDQAFRIDRVMSGVPDQFPGADKCRSGQTWDWDGINFKILWPMADFAGKKYATGNNASCVLKISSQYGTLLLTADIEKAAESKLVQHTPHQLPGDVIQIPHQGSKTSSTMAFLTSVKPKLAVLSTGYLNRFGHPHQPVSGRYRKLQVPVINTAYSGAITVHFDRTFRTEAHRDTLRGYWFEKTVR